MNIIVEINNYILSNRNITWDIVKNNPDKPWNYDWLSSNPNITWDIIKNELDKPWNYRYKNKIKENLIIGYKIYPVGMKPKKDLYERKQEWKKFL